MIKRIHMTFDQQLEADKLFAEHMWRTEDGTYRYKDGWSDEVVATTIGAQTVTQVQKFRVRRGYRFTLPEDHPKLIAKKNRSDRITDEISDMRDIFGQLQQEIQKRLGGVESHLITIENTSNSNVIRWSELHDRLNLRVNELSAKLTDIARTQSDLAKRLTDLEDVKTAPNASPHIGEGWKS